MNPPPWLYHYTTRQCALELILPEMRIRLGSLGKTNDPRETKEWGFAVTNPPPNSEEFLPLMNMVQAEMNRIRFEEWWVVCLTQNDPALIPPRENHPDFSNELWGYARPRMWAHYANDHAGVCLVFDKEPLNEAIRASIPSTAEVFHGAVVYGSEYDRSHDQTAYQVDWRPLSSDLKDGLRRHARAYREQFFLRKGDDWKTEFEYRWLVNSTGGPFFADISSALEEVIIGEEFHSSYLPSLKSACEGSGVRIGRMTWRNRIPSREYLS